MTEVLTVGHSTHSAEEFDRLLASARIELLVDVRTVPRSRRVPHAGGDKLAPRLEGRGIGYLHLPELGGLRRPRPDSPNGGWRSDAFRGYADHMDTPEFRDAIERLAALAGERRTAVMCAEALWWRCHRRLIADALVVRDRVVLHLGPDGRLTPHELTEFANVEGDRIGYPPSQAALDV